MYMPIVILVLLNVVYAFFSRIRSLFYRSESMHCFRNDCRSLWPWARTNKKSQRDFFDPRLLFSVADKLI